MLSFTKEQIDEWREIFVSRGYVQNRFLIGGRCIDYFILPEEIFQGISYGLFRMTGDLIDGYLVGVSDAVPLIVRPFFALSEHDEFMVFGLGDLDRTLHSEQRTIDLLPKRIKKEYVRCKSKLYAEILERSREDLVSFGFILEDYEGFQRAHRFLVSL